MKQNPTPRVIPDGVSDGVKRTYEIIKATEETLPQKLREMGTMNTEVRTKHNEDLAFQDEIYGSLMG